MASGVGAIVNHYADSMFCGIVTITAFDNGNKLLESYSINLETGIDN